MRRPKSPLTPALARDMQSPLPNSKAETRNLLNSLEGEIERAARESEARGTLKASVEAQKRAAAEKRKRQEELAAQVSAELARKKEVGKRKNAAPLDNGPTPERIAKLMGVEEISPPIKDDGTKALARAHLTQGVVELYRGKWKPEHQEGALFLLVVGGNAGKFTPRTTGSYDGVPTTANVVRPAGLADNALEAHRWASIVKEEIKRAFGQEGEIALEWLWETGPAVYAGASLNEQLIYLGRLIAPTEIREQRSLRLIAIGFIIALFRFSYAKWVVTETGMRRRDTSPEQTAMRRAQRIKRMQQQGLLRADQDGIAFPKGRERG